MKTRSENPDAGKTVCGIRCMRNLIAVAEFGQENVTKSGIYIPEGRSGGLLAMGQDGKAQDQEQFWRYRYGEWRFAEVISIGRGYVGNLYTRQAFEARLQQGEKVVNKVVFHDPPDVRIGDVVMFSRKHGTKVGLRYQHPKYGSLLIRFLGPAQTVAVFDDFEPWWDVEKTQVRPDQQFYG